MNDPNSDYTSPPCFAHELADADPAAENMDPATWRRQQRERLLAGRRALSANQRKMFSRQIIDHLTAHLRQTAPPGRLAAYWPIRGEPNVIEGLHQWHDLGFDILLPVVVGQAQPLIFRRWTPDTELEPGVWNIPVPPGTAPESTPDIVLMPLLGWDANGYRLGNGGGFYDRTLVTFATPPTVVGVGYQSARLPSIRPQPHDIPCDLIVTETGIVKPSAV
ncbi:MAG: 5-formyltetrahydrofolate cyclo-ligase [Saccharospirillum sp.]